MEHIKVLPISIALYMSLVISVNAQTDEVKAEIRGNIDWMIGDTGTPAKMWVWNYPVPVGNGWYVPRGPVSARWCVYYGVLFGLAGQQEYAIQWLQAGQAHNQNVMNLFATYPYYTISYAIMKYKTDALLNTGLGAWISSSNIPLAYVTSIFNGWNPAPWK